MPPKAALSRFSGVQSAPFAQPKSAQPPVDLQSRDSFSRLAPQPDPAGPAWRPELSWDSFKAGAVMAATLVGRFFSELPQTVFSTLQSWKNRLAPVRVPDAPPPLPAANSFAAFSMAAHAGSAGVASSRLKRNLAPANPFGHAVTFGGTTWFETEAARRMGRRVVTGVKSGDTRFRQVGFIPKPQGLLGDSRNVIAGVPVHNLQRPIGVVDIGTGITKLLVYSPEHPEPYQTNYPINLARKRGFSKSLADLETAMLQIKDVLQEYGVAPEDTLIVATAGLRNEQGVRVVERLNELLNPAGTQSPRYQVQIISPGQEAAYIYQGVLRDLGLPARKRATVLEVGSGSTEFAFGVGPRHIEKDLTSVGTMPIGSKNMGLGKPFDPVDVAAAQAYIKTALRNFIGPEAIQALLERPVYLGKSSIYKVLDDIETRRTGQSILRDGLSRQQLDWYLGPEGLKYLSRLHRQKLYQDAGENIVKTIVSKLVVLRQVSEVSGVDVFHFGNDGGMKSGMLDDLARRQIGDRMKEYGRALHKEYAEQLPEMLYQLEEIFPQLSRRQGAIKGRAKDAVSIADKLTRKATHTSEKDLRVVDNLDTARALINDGHGLCLVLPDSSRETIEQVRDNLIQAIKDGKIRLLEVNNYHGQDLDPPPYFTSAACSREGVPGDLDLLLAAARDQGQQVHVIDGDDGTKRSGNTTTQFEIQFRNPRTGQFENGPVAELQVRGTMLDKFSRVEHLIYDIQQGKNVFKEDESGELKALLQPVLEPLIDVLDELDEEQFARFQGYMTDMYRYIRRVENGETPPHPKLPDGLPKTLTMENLAETFMAYDTQIWLHRFRRDIKEGKLDNQLAAFT